MRRSPFHTCCPRKYSTLMAESRLTLHGTRGPVLIFFLLSGTNQNCHMKVSAGRNAYIRVYTQIRFRYPSYVEIICGPNRQSQYKLYITEKNADCCSAGFNMALASFSSTLKCKLSVLLFSSPAECAMNTLMIGRRSTQIRSPTRMIFCASVKPLQNALIVTLHPSMPGPRRWACSWMRLTTIKNAVYLCCPTSDSFFSWFAKLCICRYARYRSFLKSTCKQADKKKKISTTNQNWESRPIV